MTQKMISGDPIVSVIITCYNQGEYLHDAIESVLKQSYKNVDVIVIDDGSTDCTRELVVSFSGVDYVYQANSGLGAARNRGRSESRGRYLVFLDGDDFLYPDAIEINIRYLSNDPSLAFVSGWHEKVDQWGYPLEKQDALEVVKEKHYQNLLRGNYIGMHGSVMYAQWAFRHLRFDTTLKACEDYDLYLRLARQFNAASHSHKIAAYRIHGKNMSSNLVMMYHEVRKVCRRQIGHLCDDDERVASRDGVKVWGQYYATRLFNLLWNDLEKDRAWPSSEELEIVRRELPRKFVAFCLKKIRFLVRSRLKKTLPDSVLRTFHRLGLYKEYTPVCGRVRPGDFNRVTPFSNDFGFDRGGAIDRFYIENFIRDNASHVRGAVLEIGDNEYTLKYGRNLVEKSDILHIDCSNTRATYIGDITDIPEIPSAQFDCIIFTQTLHLIYDFRKALHTCYRVLRPGGALLLTVPGISNIDRGEWKDYWLWSFTAASMRKVMKETFNGSDVNIETYGNVFAAAAFLYGMGLPEVSKDSLMHNDPSYPLIISVKAIKR